MFAERPPGAGWSAPETIVEGRRWSIIAPDLAVNARGDAALTFSYWARQSRVVMGSYRSAGGRWEEPQALAPVGRNLGEQVVGIGERGQVVVAWSTYGAGAGLGVSRRDAARGWSDPEPIPLGAGYIEADPAFGSGGRAYLLADIFGGRATSGAGLLVGDGDRWTTLPRLPDAAGRQLQGVLAVDGGGRPTVVAFRPGERAGAGTLVVSRLGADGRWSQPRVLDRATASWFGRVETATTDEGVLVAWSRWTEPRRAVSVRAALIEDGRLVAVPAEVDAFEVPRGRIARQLHPPDTELRLAAGARSALFWGRPTAPRPSFEARLMTSRFSAGAWAAPEPVTDGTTVALPTAIHADDARDVVLWRELPPGLGGPARIVAAERATE
jgi:hypothetical protein